MVAVLADTMNKSVFTYCGLHIAMSTTFGRQAMFVVQ